MIKRLLCLLGYHEWYYWSGNKRSCWNCNKWQLNLENRK